MSVSGLSPRPHASSFSACSAASRRAAAAHHHAAAGTTSSLSMATCSTTNYNSILLGQCSIKPEPQLIYQAKKLKDTREALQAKVCVQ